MGGSGKSRGLASGAICSVCAEMSGNLTASSSQGLWLVSAGPEVPHVHLSMISSLILAKAYVLHWNTRQRVSYSHARMPTKGLSSRAKHLVLQDSQGSMPIPRANCCNVCQLCVQAFPHRHTTGSMEHISLACLLWNPRRQDLFLFPLDSQYLA